MPWTIRRAGLADADIIVDFNARLALESEGKTLSLELLRPGVAAALSDPQKGVYYLACSGSETLGQMMLTCEWSDWRNGWFWWIQSVYVRPEFRRQGVFRSLHEHVLQQAVAEPNVIGLRLYVEEENHRAQETYRRLGLSETSYFVLERYPL